MPVSFQIGLFCTVLALAVVRFLRSLREVVRSGPGRGERRAGPRGASALELPKADGVAPPRQAARARGEPSLPGAASFDGQASAGSSGVRRPDVGTPPGKDRPGSGAKGSPADVALAHGPAADARRPSGEVQRSDVQPTGVVLATDAQGRFRWQRWRHLAILWGLVLFCGPFLFGLALPGHMRELSLALDSSRRALAPDLSSPRTRADSGPLTRETAERELGRSVLGSAREARLAWTMLLASGAAVAAGAVASGLAARRRSPRAMSALALAGVVAACAGVLFAGPIASRLSGALAAREAIEAYASAPAVGAGEAARLAGPVRLVGRPLPGTLVAGRSRTHTPGTSVGKELLYYHGPHEEDGAASAVYAGFRLGAVAVSPSSPSDCRVVRSHVRLAARGREHFIRADEDVMVMGFLLDGVLRPRPGYPLVVAPADASRSEGGAAQPRAGQEALDAALLRPESRAGALGPSPGPRRTCHPGLEGRAASRIFEALAADLLGTAPARAGRLALLQVAFGSALGWFLTILAASATERLLGGRMKAGPQASSGAAGEPCRPSRSGGRVGPERPKKCETG